MGLDQSGWMKSAVLEQISLFNCDANFGGSHDCNHTDDVGVICQPSE